MADEQNVHNITTKLFDEIWRRIFNFLHPNEVVKSWISIPIIRQKTLQKEDLMAVAKMEIESYGHDFKAVCSRLGMLTEKDGLVIVNSFYKQRRCFRSGCMQLFSERYNFKDSCLYHSGKQGAGKVMSCCRGHGFKSVPCKSGFHDGKVFDAIMITPTKDVNNEKNTSAIKSTVTTSLPPIILCKDITSASRVGWDGKNNFISDFSCSSEKKGKIGSEISLPAVS